MGSASRAMTQMDDLNNLTCAALADLLLDAMGSLVDDPVCRYVAGPLATGREYYDLVGRDEFDGEELRQKNAGEMRRFVRRLRAAHPTVPVIDSGVLRVPMWTGSQHGEFFLEVIERMCTEVVFMDGWEFSLGATREFVFAQRICRRCVDQSTKDELSADYGAALIRSAVHTVEKLGHKGERLRSRIASLDELS